MMRSWQSTLVGVLGYFVLTGAAGAAPVIVYDGNAVPTAQGWTRHTIVGPGGPATETVGAGTTEFSTLNFSSGHQSGTTNEYQLATGATNFVVSIRVKATVTSYNNLDAGLTFSAYGSGGPQASERFSNVAISPGKIQFGDAGGSFVVDTTVFHEYAMRLINGNLSVYVDGNFDDIVAGTAVPVMSRSNVVPQTGRIPGNIVFGDATNDANYDSLYTVDFVKFYDYGAQPPIPVMDVTFKLTAPAQGTITFLATPNSIYQVQASPTLLAGTWTSIGNILATTATTSVTIVAANPASGQLTDPLLATAPKRFYRIAKP